MRAAYIEKYGEADVIQLGEIPRPASGPEELLVEVHACAMNPVDYKIRAGHLKELFSVNFPRILGGDISGVVKERGSQASDFEVGDEVYFSDPLDRNGGNAEFCVVPQSIVAKKPPSLSHVEAASLPVAGLTSIQALRDFCGIKAGSKVLIHAGAGGVGSFAIQYAKHMGAKVFTTASSAKHSYLRSLGADEVIDYRNQDFVQICRAAGGMDMVLEALGGPTYMKSLLATREGGSVPCIVHPPDSDCSNLAHQRRIKTDFLLLKGSRNDLEEISRLVENGNVKPTVSRVLTLEETTFAHRELEAGHIQGKWVLVIKKAEAKR